MPHGLKRFQQSAQSHFVTFTCYHRRRGFDSPAVYDLFVQVLEEMRRRFALCVYGYVVMPEHVHLLVSEPTIPRVAPKSEARTLRLRSGQSLATQPLLADAMHYLKLSFAKRLGSGVFWQKRYYDRNVRDEREFVEKLRYIHRNPVKRGLVMNAEDWKWSSFRHYALREKGVVEIESEWTARDREKQAMGGGERTFLIPG
ncbi:MAG TPA: transposase [Terriglobales bacterium]